MIDPKAIVDSGSSIAEDASIGPYAVIGSGVSIASGTVVEHSASILGPAEIGRDNHIFQFCSIGADPQDKKYQKGETSTLVIGDNNTIREYCSINRGTAEGGGTVIGNGNWIMAGVHVAHDCVIGNNCVFANSVAMSGHVELGDYVTLSGYSAVSQFCRIGSHAFAAGYAAIDCHIPPFAYVAHNRARFVGVNSRGLSRRGFSEDRIALIKRIYRCWYRKEDKIEDRLQSIKELGAGQEDIMEFIDFIDAVSDSHVSIVPHNSRKVPVATDA